MSTNIHRHTARPSRSRVILARVAGALGKAHDYLERHLVAFALTCATLASVTLALMIAFADDRYTTALIAVVFSVGIGFFVFVATDDAMTRAYHEQARATLAQHEQDARAYREREQRHYQEQHEQRTRGAREFRITLNAPRYYNETQSVLATLSDGVRTIDCGGRAYYDGKKSGEQVKREAFYDALEDACLKLTSASASLLAEDEHLALSVSPTVVRMMPTFSENE